MVKAPAIHEVISDQEKYTLPIDPSISGSPNDFYWSCNFCGTQNFSDFLSENDQIPSENIVDYILEAPIEIKEGENEEGITNVVFCIDISGSMCVTSEIPGKFQIKGAQKREEEMKAILKDLGEENQHIGRSYNRNTMVSRLQCVQAAVEQQIERFYNEKGENVRVSLITFNNEVSLLGDASSLPQIIAGDKLSNFNDLQEIGNNFPQSKTLKESKEKLIERLWNLEEGGGTSLGPALQLSIAIAGSSPGSSVILCTDGLANVGLGSLVDKESDYAPYYVELAEQAKLKGVTVSVVSIKGEECSLESISIVCEQTGGQVDRVDPAQLLQGEKFSAVVGAPIVAYHTMAMILLHRGVRFHQEIDDEENRNWLVKDIGNVVMGKELSFAYRFRPKSEIDMSGMNHVPFQVQLLHTRPDGMKYVRVATSLISLTNDKKEAEKGVNVAMMANHSIQRAAKLAKAGDYELAQEETKNVQRILKKGKESAQNSSFLRKVEQLDQVINSEEQFNDEDGDEAFARKKARRANRGDKDAYTISSLM